VVLALQEEFLIFLLELPELVEELPDRRQLLPGKGELFHQA
jgi:hypothetical protein